MVKGICSVTSCTINTDNVNGTDLRLGMLNWTGHEMYFDGLLDDVRLHSRDLTDVEIASLGGYHQQAFTYDRLGNRLTLSEPRNDSTTTYTYNAANEIATINGSGVTYDNAGNLTDDGTYDYYYDHENRLTRVADTSGTLAEYTYDALGRRIEKIQYNDSAPLTVTTRYYYDGWRVLTETNGADVAQRDYAYGNYLDEALLMVDMTGESDVDYYFAHDHLYSPVALLESDGDLAERYEYDAYGHRRVYDPDFTDQRSTSDYTLTVAFTGQRLDLLDSGDLPLMYYKNRILSIPLARFLQRDPLGLQPEGYQSLFGARKQYTDGANLYEAFKSNSLIYSDAMGLEPASSNEVCCKINEAIKWRPDNAGMNGILGTVSFTTTTCRQETIPNPGKKKPKAACKCYYKNKPNIEVYGAEPRPCCWCSVYLVWKTTHVALLMDCKLASDGWSLDFSPAYSDKWWGKWQPFYAPNSLKYRKPADYAYKDGDYKEYQGQISCSNAEDWGNNLEKHQETFYLSKNCQTYSRMVAGQMLGGCP